MIKKRDVATLILLSFITCGIYSLFFWWGYIKDINKVCEGDGKKSPNYLVVFLLTILTFGLYDFYWSYKQGNRLQAIAPNYGLSFANGGSAVLTWNLIGSLVSAGGALLSQLIQSNNPETLLPVNTIVSLVFSLAGYVFFAVSWNILIKNLNAAGAVYNLAADTTAE